MIALIHYAIHGSGRPCRRSGGNGSAHVPRRRPRLSRMCGYAAAGGHRRGQGTCREAVFSSDVYSKSDREADPLCEGFLTPNAPEAPEAQMKPQ